MFINSFVFTEVWLIYNVVLTSGIKQSDSQISFFQILFHYTLSQDIEYSFLCYTEVPYCSSILYIVICIC